MKRAASATTGLTAPAVIRLSTEGQRQIAVAILNPPVSSPAHLKAAKRYFKMLGAFK
jgi:hypothetical protein